MIFETKAIALELLTEGITVPETARALGMSPKRYGEKLRRCSFTVSELFELAEILGYGWEAFAAKFGRRL